MSEDNTVFIEEMLNEFAAYIQPMMDQVNALEIKFDKMTEILSQSPIPTDVSAEDVADLKLLSSSYSEILKRVFSSSRFNEADRKKIVQEIMALPEWRDIEISQSNLAKREAVRNSLFNGE